jgi:hypothetical protein
MTRADARHSAVYRIGKLRVGGCGEFGIYAYTNPPTMHVADYEDQCES